MATSARQTNQMKERRLLADKWAGSACSLRGVPAKITGRLEAFGSVSPLDPEIGAIEYSWQTIDRVMESGGLFTD